MQARRRSSVGPEMSSRRKTIGAKLPRRNTLHVLHILNELRYSGAEIMLAAARGFFKENRIHTTILSTGETPGSYTDVLRACGYTLDHIPFRRSLRYFQDMYSYLKRRRFDVIHIHPERAYFYHALIARAATRARLVRTFHDVFFQYEQFKKIIRRTQRWGARRFLGVRGVAIGESVREVELQEFGNPTVVVNNWIDEEAFHVPTDEQRKLARNKFDLAEDDFVLCTIGTCNEKKRHCEIFRAMALIRQRIPSIVLLHRGTGPDTEREIEYVKSLGVEGNVCFLDYLDFLPTVFWAADAFILASHWEGLGDVIIEALACGMPVILYDGWGMKDFKPFDGDSFGYWMNPKPEELASAVLDFYEKGQTSRLAFQRNARRFFEAGFSRRQSLQKLISLYRTG